MTRRRAGTLVLALVLSLIGSRAEAQGRFDLEKTKTVLTGLIETAIKEQGIPSISIALVKGDAIVWKAAFGYANIRTRTPATTATLYSTGSTFKSVTATALMQLAEQDKFKLEQPVNSYLGDFRVQDRLQSDKEVNFIHILSHWSGLSDNISFPPVWGRELPKTLEKLVSGLYSIRAPEAKWEYNNSAYGMAGLLVQRISGVEYEKYVIDNVLVPLGVGTPHPAYPTPEMVELMALPYDAGGYHGEPKPMPQVHFDVYPAGDIWLTAEDMARYLGAQLNGGMFNGHRILSEASVKAMQTARFGGTYGFGLQISKDSSGHTIITHGGGIPGQSSLLKGDVDAHVGVYFMSNSGAPSEIADAALKLLRGEDYVPRKGIAVDPAVLETYVGTYELGSEAVFTVTRDGSVLLGSQEGARAKQVLLAETPMRFFLKANPDVSYTFVKGASGAVEEMVIEFGGEKHIAKRRK